jgi:hypothetical protein
MNKRNPSYTRWSNIPEHIYIEAEIRAKNQRVFTKSHRKDEANGVGCLGEVIAECWMKHHDIPFSPELEKTTHDYVVDNNLIIDVKAKDRTVKPKFDYDNSAPLYNQTYQWPDYFFFISLERDKSNKTKDVRKLHTAYILGAISYQELDRIGIPFLEGEKGWRNDTNFWTDCLNVEMWQLIPLTETIDIFKGLINSPSSNAAVNIKIIKEMEFRSNSNQLKPRNLPSIIHDLNVTNKKGIEHGV